MVTLVSKELLLNFCRAFDPQARSSFPYFRVLIHYRSDEDNRDREISQLPRSHFQAIKVNLDSRANVGRILLISAQTFFFCLDKSCTTWKKNYFKWKGSCFACKWNFKVKRSPLRLGQPSINIALPVDDLKSKIRCWIIDRANLMCMCIRKMEKIFRDALYPLDIRRCIWCITRSSNFSNRKSKLL